MDVGGIHLNFDDVQPFEAVQLSQFKVACLKTMKMLFPDGPGGATMHRNMILAYAMAWGDVLHRNPTPGNVVLLEQHKDETTCMRSADWWPDSSWCWW